jgi:hypothetical protein
MSRSHMRSPPLRFSNQNYVHTSQLSHACYMSWPSHPPNTGWRVQIMKLLILQFTARPTDSQHWTRLWDFWFLNIIIIWTWPAHSCDASGMDGRASCMPQSLCKLRKFLAFGNGGAAFILLLCSERATCFITWASKFFTPVSPTLWTKSTKLKITIQLQEYVVIRA